MTKHVYYLPHGGGPMPLMGDARHKSMVALMRGLAEPVSKSRAVVVVTAHWEADAVTFSGAPNPGMLFDYYGFPAETYEYDYPAPGAADLAGEARDLLRAAGLEARIDTERGYDHGTFVPMMLIRPEADIPVLQMSLKKGLDPAAHIAAGHALAPLLDHGVTLLGSGMSFHNLRTLIQGDPKPNGEDEAFDDWLNETVLVAGLDDAERAARLTDWRNAPGAEFCHPREEHLMPLHVCYGAAAETGLGGESVYRERLLGVMTSGFGWS